MALGEVSWDASSGAKQDNAPSTSRFSNGYDGWLLLSFKKALTQKLEVLKCQELKSEVIHFDVWKYGGVLK